MTAKLSLDNGKEIILKDQESIIGRDEFCDICFDDKLISKRHCRIINKDGRFIIEDLNSLNGTYTNSLRIDKEYLHNGDVIRIGSVRLHFWGATKYDYFLDVQNLSYHLSGKIILENISLSLKNGEFIALIGPSGSGKSTLLGLLSGAFAPSSGSIFLNGMPIEFSGSELLGFVPQRNIVHENLSIEDTFFYAARLKGLNKREAKARKEWLLKQLELSIKSKNLVKQLSGGEQKRVNIGIELLHKPAFLFLDEPTTGLDPALEDKMMHFFKTLSENGTGVLASTHITEHLFLCDKIIFLVDGRVLFYGKPKELLHTFDAKNFNKIFSLANSKNIWELKQRITKIPKQNTPQRQKVLPIKTSRKKINIKKGELKILVSRYLRILKNSKKDLAFKASLTREPKAMIHKSFPSSNTSALAKAIFSFLFKEYASSLGKRILTGFFISKANSNISSNSSLSFGAIHTRLGIILK